MIATFHMIYPAYVKSMYLSFSWLLLHQCFASGVDGIDFFVTDTFGEELFDSCKDVKFGTMNTRAIDFIGAGAKNFKGEMLSCGGFISML